MVMGTTRVAITVVAGTLVFAAAAVSSAEDAGSARSDRDGGEDRGSVREELTGYQEDPLAVSTTGHGTFRARLDDDEIKFRLRYADLVGDVQQAHIHFGGAAQSGGISTFLCSNLGNGPAGTQACPPAPATVSGTIDAVDVIGPAAQGIAPGELAELLAAINAETAYVNLHSTAYPGGEIRADITDGRDD